MGQPDVRMLLSLLRTLQLHTDLKQNNDAGFPLQKLV